MLTPPAFSHAPVLLDEVLVFAQPATRMLDCTLGGAGHAAALLQHVPHATLVGLDRDPDALAAAAQTLSPFGQRATCLQAQFGPQTTSWAAQAASLPGPRFDFVLADFGVSSHQLDCAKRGFSFRADAPLDMRMGQDGGETAAALIERLDADALADLLYHLGEERRARPIARAIVRERPKTTDALAQIVRRVLWRPGQKDRPRIDPATRTFMALRMAVNDELGEISALLEALPALVAPGGRIALISFHSLEDRLVKRALLGPATPCICPSVLKQCQCKPPLPWQVPSKRPVTACAAECARNPRARSAKLRLATRVP